MRGASPAGDSRRSRDEKDPPSAAAVAVALERSLDLLQLIRASGMLSPEISA